MADRIDIVVDLNDARAESGIDRLTVKLKALQAENTKLSGTTFNAFSRAQVQPLIEANDKLIASIQKTRAELMLVGNTVSLQEAINRFHGLNEELNSAAASAKNFKEILKTASGAAIIDNAERTAVADATRKQQEYTQAVIQGARNRAAAIKAESDIKQAAMDAEFARLSSVPLTRVSRAQPTFKSPEDEIESLSKDIIQKGELLALTVGQQIGQETAKELEQAIQTAHARIAALNAGGAQPSGPNYSQLVKNDIASAIATFNTNSFKDAGAHFAQVKANEAVQKESVASISAAVAAYEALHGKVGKVGSALRDTSNEASKLGGILQHTTGIGDSLLRGRIGGAEASFVALIRDAGLLRAAISSLSGPWGAVAAVGVASLAAIGYEAEQSYKRLESIRTVSGQLAVKGFGSNNTAEVAKDFDQARESTNEYAGVEAKFRDELAKLPPAALGIRNAVEDIGKSFAALTKQDPAKVIEELSKAFGKSPEAAAKLLSEMYGLDGVLNAAGKSIDEVAKSGGDASVKFANLVKFVQEVTGNLISVGKESANAKNSIIEASIAVGTMADEFGRVGPELEQFGGLVQKAIEPLKDANTPVFALSAAIREQNKAISEGNSGLIKREELQRQFQASQDAVKRLSTDPGATVEQISRAQSAQSNLGAQVGNSSLEPGEENSFKLRLEQIQAVAAARRADLAAQAQAKDQELALVREEEAIKFKGPGVSDQQAGQLAESTARVKAAEEASLEAHRKVEDQKAQITNEGIRAQVAEEARGAAERIALQKQSIENTRARVAAGRESATALASEQVKLAQLERQVANKNFQDQRDQSRAMVVSAQGDVTQINAAFDAMRGAAKSTGQTPQVGSEINREQLQALKSANSEAFTQLTEFNSSAERLDAIRTSANKAQLQAQVAAHALSKEQMASKEAEFTSLVMAEEEKRLSSEIQNINLTAEQRQKLQAQLAELYAKDAENQLNAQKQITEAVEAENKKRVESFSKMFDTVGTGLEKLVEEGLTRSTTKKKAFQQFGGTLLRSGLGEIETQGSRYLGGAIGPELGLSKEQSKGGLGSVLGESLAKRLGLLKDDPKTDQTKLAETIQKATDAQKEALGKNTTAIDNLNKSISSMNNLSKTPVGGKPEGSAASSQAIGSDGPAQVLASNVQINTDALKQLSAMLAQASKSLPAGYSAQITSTERPGATVAGTGGVSQHALGDAMDVRIVNPSGGTVSGFMGSDSSGMYTQLAVAMEKAQQQLYPELAGKLASGTQFGKQDSGHFDLGGDRGIRGQLSDLSGGFQQLSGSLGNVVPGFKQLSAGLGTVQGILNGTQKIFSTLTGTTTLLTTAKTAESTATTSNTVGKVSNTVAFTADSAAVQANAATQASSAATGGIGSLIKGIPLIGSLLSLSGGGVIPSAANGMIAAGSLAGGGQLSILHPNEMVLPSPISRGLQGMIQQNSGGGNHYAPQVNYNANMTGYHPYASQSSFEGALRQHGNTLMNHVSNLLRNGWRP